MSSTYLPVLPREVARNPVKQTIQLLPATMLSVFQNFQDYPISAIISLSAVITLSIIYVFILSPQHHSSSKAPKPVREGYPIIGALRFFTARWDFFQHARSQTSSGNFSFKIGKHFVVGLSGDKGRQVFFENRDLGFQEG